MPPDVVDSLATGVAGAAVVIGTVVLMGSRSARVALQVLLDLLLAAGLLRLILAETWPAIATAAALVVVRRVTVATLPAERSGPS